MYVTSWNNSRFIKRSLRKSNSFYNEVDIKQTLWCFDAVQMNFAPQFLVLSHWILNLIEIWLKNSFGDETCRWEGILPSVAWLVLAVISNLHSLNLVESVLCPGVPLPIRTHHSQTDVPCAHIHSFEFEEWNTSIMHISRISIMCS